MLQRFHILLEVRHPGLRLDHRSVQGRRRLLKLLYSCLSFTRAPTVPWPESIFALTEFKCAVAAVALVDGLLTAVQNAAGFLEQIRHHQRRHARYGLAILHFGLPGRSKRNRHVLIAQQPFGFDRGHRILLDNLVRGLCPAP